MTGWKLLLPEPGQCIAVRTVVLEEVPLGDGRVAQTCQDEMCQLASGHEGEHEFGPPIGAGQR